MGILQRCEFHSLQSVEVHQKNCQGTTEHRMHFLSLKDILPEQTVCKYTYVQNKRRTTYLRI